MCKLVATDSRNSSVNPNSNSHRTNMEVTMIHENGNNGGSTMQSANLSDLSDLPLAFVEENSTATKSIEVTITSGFSSYKDGYGDRVIQIEEYVRLVLINKDKDGFSWEELSDRGDFSGSKVYSTLDACLDKVKINSPAVRKAAHKAYATKIIDNKWISILVVRPHTALDDKAKEIAERDNVYSTGTGTVINEKNLGKYQFVKVEGNVHTYSKIYDTRAECAKDAADKPKTAVQHTQQALELEFETLTSENWIEIVEEEDNEYIMVEKTKIPFDQHWVSIQLVSDPSTTGRKVMKIQSDMFTEPYRLYSKPRMRFLSGQYITMKNSEYVTLEGGESAGDFKAVDGQSAFFWFYKERPAHAPSNKIANRQKALKRFFRRNESPLANENGKVSQKLETSSTSYLDENGNSSLTDSMDFMDLQEEILFQAMESKEDPSKEWRLGNTFLKDEEESDAYASTLVERSGTQDGNFSMELHDYAADDHEVLGSGRVLIKNENLSSRMDEEDQFLMNVNYLLKEIPHLSRKQAERIQEMLDVVTGGDNSEKYKWISRLRGTGDILTSDVPDIETRVNSWNDKVEKINSREAYNMLRKLSDGLNGNEVLEDTITEEFEKAESMQVDTIGLTREDMRRESVEEVREILGRDQEDLETDESNDLKKAMRKYGVDKEIYGMLWTERMFTDIFGHEVPANEPTNMLAQNRGLTAERDEFKREQEIANAIAIKDPNAKADVLTDVQAYRDEPPTPSYGYHPASDNDWDDTRYKQVEIQKQVWISCGYDRAKAKYRFLPALICKWDPNIPKSARKYDKSGEILTETVMVFVKDKDRLWDAPKVAPVITKSAPVVRTVVKLEKIEAKRQAIAVKRGWVGLTKKNGLTLFGTKSDKANWNNRTKSEQDILVSNIDKDNPLAKRLREHMASVK